MRDNSQIPSTDPEAEVIRNAFSLEPDDVFNAPNDDPYYEYVTKSGERYFVFNASQVRVGNMKYVIIKP